MLTIYFHQNNLNGKQESQSEFEQSHAEMFENYRGNQNTHVKY